MKRKLDYYGGFSSLQTRNSIPMDAYHNNTAVANLGWNWSAKTEIRGTVRHTVAASGLPAAQTGYAFYGLSNDGKQQDQDTYGTGTIAHQFRDNWKTSVRYGLVRKREESQQWYPAGNLIDGNYYGNDVTVKGANGTVASGQALMNFGPVFGAVYPYQLALASNRDDLFAQMNYVHGSHLAVTGGFRYEDERGLESEPAYAFHRAMERANYDYQAEIGGQFRNRLFYTAAGNVEKNALFGTVGTPHIGASYYLVRPGQGVLHGTKLEFNFARGYQEPTIDEQFGSLYSFLVQNGGQATAAQYGIRPIGAPHLLNVQFRSAPVGLWEDRNAKLTHFLVNGSKCPPRAVRIRIGVPSGRSRPTLLTNDRLARHELRAGGWVIAPWGNARRTQ